MLVFDVKPAAFPAMDLCGKEGGVSVRAPSQ